MPRKRSNGEQPTKFGIDKRIIRSREVRYPKSKVLIGTCDDIITFILIKDGSRKNGLPLWYWIGESLGDGGNYRRISRLLNLFIGLKRV